jgi:hypothetical protein
MTERKLKYSLGLFLIVSHFGLLISCIIFYFLNGFSIEEFTTVVAIIAPVFAGYTTSILAFIIKDAHVLKDETKRVTPVYSIISFVIPLLLVTIFGLSIGLKAFNKAFADFEDFKRFLILIESMFAAYVGMFVYSLFEKQTPVGVPDK